MALPGRPGIALDWRCLGDVYHQGRGELEQAEAMYQKALDLHGALGHKQGMALDYVYLGSVYQIRGELEQAYNKNVDLLKALAYEQGKALDYIYPSDAYGMLAESEAMYQKAQILFHDIGDAPQVENVQELLDSLWHAD